MMRYRIHISLFLVYFAMLAPAFASPSHVKATLIAEQKTMEPGKNLQAGLLLEIEKGWHVYWINPGDSGLAPSLEWQLPAGFRSDPLAFPYPERFHIENSVNYGYEKEVLLTTTIYVPTSLLEGQTKLKARAQWLSCRDVCIPGEAELTLELPVKNKTAKLDSKWKKKFRLTGERIPRRIPGWISFAKAKGNLVILTLVSQQQIQMKNLDFFALEEGVLDHAYKPDITFSGNQIEIKLRVDSKRTDPLKNLRGVAVSQKPWVGNSKSLLIDTIIQ